MLLLIVLQLPPPSLPVLLFLPTLLSGGLGRQTLFDLCLLMLQLRPRIRSAGMRHIGMQPMHPAATNPATAVPFLAISLLSARVEESGGQSKGLAMAVPCCL